MASLFMNRLILHEILRHKTVWVVGKPAPDQHVTCGSQSPFRTITLRKQRVSKEPKSEELYCECKSMLVGPYSAMSRVQTPEGGLERNHTGK